MKKCIFMFSLLVITIVIAAITENNKRVEKEQEVTLKETNNNLDSLIANTTK